MNDSIAASIAQQIKELRRHHQWTQAELAKHVGTSQRAIVRIEKGETSPNVATLVKIAQAFGTNLNISFDTARQSSSDAAQHDANTLNIDELAYSIKTVKESLKENVVSLLNTPG